MSDQLAAKRALTSAGIIGVGTLLMSKSLRLGLEVSLGFAVAGSLVLDYYINKADIESSIQVAKNHIGRALEAEEQPAEASSYSQALTAGAVATIALAGGAAVYLGRYAQRRPGGQGALQVLGNAIAIFRPRDLVGAMIATFRQIWHRNPLPVADQDLQEVHDAVELLLIRVEKRALEELQNQVVQPGLLVADDADDLEIQLNQAPRNLVVLEDDEKNQVVVDVPLRGEGAVVPLVKVEKGPLKKILSEGLYMQRIASPRAVARTQMLSTPPRDTRSPIDETITRQAFRERLDTEIRTALIQVARDVDEEHADEESDDSSSMDFTPYGRPKDANYKHVEAIVRDVIDRALQKI